VSKTNKPLIKEETLKFWETEDFEKQKYLIAGETPWEIAATTAGIHDMGYIETPIIKKYMHSKLNPTILEIGCGVARILKFWPYKAIGVDISENMLTKAALECESFGKKDIKFIKTDGRTIDVEDKSVNLVYSFLVFQHIQTLREIKTYMEEISRILAPGGYFRVQTLKGTPHSEDFFGGFNGRLYPSIQEFTKDLSGFGLTVVEQAIGLGHPDWFWLTMERE
jgi:SAM-dependent methyltransferase